MCRYHTLLIVFCLQIAVARSMADEVDYVRQIKPLLTEKCYSCHGALKQESQLRLETRSLMIRGGDSGQVIVPGDPEQSLLFQRASAADDDERMPPPEQGSALLPDQVALLRQWIQQGAPAPDEAAPPSPNEHWAFQPIVRPEIPAGPSSSQANPIDALLEAKRGEKGLRLQPQAPRSILIRRLYLDLIGLPPTAEQLSDQRPWHVIVDELLASPHHGERWARHWMDVWRYCDWYGLGNQLRFSQKHLWHWRDWIVDSLNEDKGYDRMILEMLAGDELAPEDPDVIAATGFLARNYYLFNRTTWLDSTIEHTSKAFLGLTLNCAKCHDHKYDPITQLDYYGFRAIFEPHQVRLDPVPGVVDFEQDGLPRVFDEHIDLETHLHVRGDPANPDMQRRIDAGMPAILASFAPEIEPLSLPVSAYAPGARDHVARDRLREAEKDVLEAEGGVAAARRKLAETGNDASASSLDVQAAVAVAAAKLAAAQAGMHAIKATIAADKARYLGASSAESIRELSSQAARLQAESQLASAQHQLLAAAGDEQKENIAKQQLDAAKNRLAAIEKGEVEYAPIRGAKKALESPAHKEEDYPAAYSPISSGRRLALARWMASSQNPLTARVAVNHVWMRHFGTPLVESVSDFGLRANEPLHHELLDWLAAEFIESGWSMQHLHRLIVTSETFRLSSSTLDCDRATMAADPTNQYYWRMNPRRMESQVVRDSLLKFAGKLDARLGGPSIDPAVGATRRSLYFKHSLDEQDKFLEMFDDADVLECYRRSESIVPQQALALSNSSLAIQMAGNIAREIFESLETPDRNAYIAAVFSLLLGREATDAEVRQCQEFFDEMAALQGDRPADPYQERARVRFVQSILNHNDFITIR